jgi:hypothetical protein
MTDHKDSAKASGAHGAPSEKKHAEHGDTVFQKRIEATPVRETHPPKK